MYLVEVDDGLPEVVGLLVEVSHTNLTEVTGMVLFSESANSRPFVSFLVVGLSNLVHVGTVVVLTTGKTTTTGMLAVLSDTSLTGGNVAAADSQSQSITSSFVYFIIRPVLSYFRAAADKGRLL
jgi:hypothetical protein